MWLRILAATAIAYLTIGLILIPVNSYKAAARKHDSRIPILDGVRGTAILIVVVYHYFCIPGFATSIGPWHRIAPAMYLGWAGVDLFFVLSGFLIGGILIDNQGSSSYFSTFYRRRFFRILPLYFLLLVSYACAAGTNAVPSLLKERIPWVSYLFFVQNLEMFLRSNEPGFGRFSSGPGWLSGTWSLAVEEQFYLILPAVVRRLSMTQIKILAVLMVVLAPVARWSAFHFAGAKGFTGAYVMLPSRMDGLGFGLLAAVLWRQKKMPGMRWLAAVIPVLVWGFWRYTVLGGQVVLRQALAGYSVSAAAAFVFLLFCLSCSKNSMLSWTLCSRPMVFLGKTSYCLYLCHGIILAAGFSLVFGTEPFLGAAPSVALVIICLGLSLGLSWASWKYFESPLLDFAKRYRYSHRNA